MLRVVELYSGIGGMHFALESKFIQILYKNETKIIESEFEGSKLKYEVVAAIDINPVCNNVYQANFPSTTLISKCLTSLDEEDFDNFNADMVVMSPPCQPFTVIGKQKDMRDKRTESFQHFADLLPRMKNLPKLILLENVRGMETSQMRTEFVKILVALNYNIQEFMLCPTQFKIPNSRKRYYLLAKLNPLTFPFEIRSELISDIGEIVQFIEATPEKNDHSNSLNSGNVVPCLNNYLEKANDDYFNQFLIDKKLFKKFWIMDLVSKDSQTCCCFTKGYGRHIEKAGSIVQMQASTTDLWKYQRNEDCPEFIEEIEKLKLRFFTPREIANLMSFPDTLVFPKCMTHQQCYRVLGNSISVYVVSFLLNVLTA